MSLTGIHRARNVWLSSRIMRTPSVTTGLTGSGGDGRDTATAAKTTSGTKPSAIVATCFDSNAGTGDCPQ